MSDEKAREARARRLATRQGLVLRRSRTRDRRVLDYGRYYLIIPEYNAVLGSQPNGLTIDDVESWLAERADKTRS